MNPSPEPSGKKKNETDLAEIVIERGLLLARHLLLLPLILCALFMMAYTLTHVQEIWHGFNEAFSHHGDPTVRKGKLLMLVLEGVDLVLVGSFVYMIVIGTYQQFISKIDTSHLGEDTPAWLNHLNIGKMKVKLAAALIGISSVHLLTTFMSEEVKWDTVWKQLAIHFMLMISALVILVIYKKTDALEKEDEG